MPRCEYMMDNAFEQEQLDNSVKGFSLLLLELAKYRETLSKVKYCDKNCQSLNTIMFYVCRYGKLVYLLELQPNKCSLYVAVRILQEA